MVLLPLDGAGQRARCGGGRKGGGRRLLQHARPARLQPHGEHRHRGRGEVRVGRRRRRLLSRGRRPVLRGGRGRRRRRPRRLCRRRHGGREGGGAALGGVGLVLEAAVLQLLLGRVALDVLAQGARVRVALRAAQHLAAVRFLKQVD